jgi:DUF1365 family protein
VSDPQVVLQAHALRSKATSDALLHGARRPRTRRALLGALIGSTTLAAVIAVTIIVVGRIVTVLHHTGH